PRLPLLVGGGGGQVDPLGGEHEARRAAHRRAEGDHRRQGFRRGGGGVGAGGGERRESTLDRDAALELRHVPAHGRVGGRRHTGRERDRDRGVAQLTRRASDG